MTFEGSRTPRELWSVNGNKEGRTADGATKQKLMLERQQGLLSQAVVLAADQWYSYARATQRRDRKMGAKGIELRLSCDGPVNGLSRFEVVIWNDSCSINGGWIREQHDSLSQRSEIFSHLFWLFS